MIAYACQNKNDEDRKISSSGGIFLLISKHIIKLGGVVYGAAYDEQFHVVHKRVDNMDDLEFLCGSKYTYSRFGDSINNCERDLVDGKRVLFVGTPCQINAIRKRFGNQYNNLILVDIVCHGTPDSKFYEKYLIEISKGRKIRKINFRDKSTGWKNYSVSISFENEECYQCTHQNDLFIKGMVLNLTLRKACFDCQAKSTDIRNADMTLGDCWGINQFSPLFDDDMGTSLVLIHSDSGREIFSKLSENYEMFEIDYDSAISANPSIIHKALKNLYYYSFQHEFDKGKDLIWLLSKYCNSNWRLITNRIFWKIKNGWIS